jgi:hypothetical protein
MEAGWTLPHTPKGIYGEPVGDQVRSTGGGPDENGYAMSGWGWLLMTLGMLGFCTLVAVLALALLRRPGQPDQQPRPGSVPGHSTNPGGRLQAWA